MPLFGIRNSEKGQILLIVVLASVISLTVGLAAISRSITNTRVSTEEANSQKALAAAEAGVEEQLNKANIGSPTSETLSNNSNFSASAEALDGVNVLINNGLPVPKDEGADIWLSTYPDFTNPMSNTRLILMWNGGATCAQEPAIEIAFIYGDRDNPNMGRYALDSCEGTRNNNFDPPSTTTRTVNIDGVNHTFNRSFTFPSGNVDRGYIARVIPLYNNAVKMAVSSTNVNVPLPAQGYIVNSTGTSGSTVRKVRVFQGFPRLPVEFFPYNLFLP